MNGRTTLVALVLAALLMLSVPLAQAAEDPSEDRVITQNVYSALAKEFNAQFSEPVEVTVKTFHGVVVLNGSATEREPILKASEIASKVAGVKSVDNRMTIRSTY